MSIRSSSSTESLRSYSENPWVVAEGKELSRSADDDAGCLLVP